MFGLGKQNVPLIFKFLRNRMKILIKTGITV